MISICWHDCQHEGRVDHPLQERCRRWRRDGTGGLARAATVATCRPWLQARAVYAVDGVRVVGFDNERGKGDHCPLNGRELPYTFTTVDAWVEDFIAAVDAARRTP